jgi:hypothetical protein
MPFLDVTVEDPGHGGVRALSLQGLSMGEASGPKACGGGPAGGYGLFGVHNRQWTQRFQNAPE